MQREVALAQANTLREWSAQWKRDGAGVAYTEGFDNVAFLLSRCARDIERIFGVASQEVPEPIPVDTADQVRAG